MAEVYVGRQPIFDRNLEVVAYELLYRSADMSKADFSDGNAATSSVISNTFMEIGLERLIGDKLAFINLTREFICGKFPIPKRTDKFVLEVLENIVIDEELISAIDGLNEEGFIIALDDVTNPYEVEALLNKVHIVKIDLMACDKEDLPINVKILKSRGLKLVAEKVETQEELDFCMKLGFDFFQGYFLCKPNVVKEKKMSSSKMSVMRLLSELQGADAEFSNIDDIIKQDVSLSYKLLRLINSAYYKRVSEIKSIKQALTMLGLKQIRSWVSLLLLSDADDKPKELMTTAMVRGKMAELIAVKLGSTNPEVQFTVGLFSVLDALLDLPLEEVLAQVPLSKDINAALLKGEGDLGHLLNCILAYEKGDWDKVVYRRLEPKVISECYLEAVKWADDVSKILSTVPGK